MSDFLLSTHLEHWTYPNVQSLRQKLRDLHMDYNRFRTSGGIDAQVSLEEEFQLHSYYEMELTRFMDSLQKPHRHTQQTVNMALMYFKRFFLTCSILEYHPLYVAFSSAYLAMKVDEHPIRITSFVKEIVMFRNHGQELQEQSGSIIEPNYEEADYCEIIKHFELLIVDKINYQLLIRTPDRALLGFVEDMTTRWIAADYSKVEYIRSVYPVAQTLIRESVLSDCLFLFPPSIIALTSLVFAATTAPGSRITSFDSYILAVLLGHRDGAGGIARRIRLALRKVYKVINEGIMFRKGLDMDHIRNTLIEKWKLCCDGANCHDLRPHNVSVALGEESIIFQ